MTKPGTCRHRRHAARFTVLVAAAWPAAVGPLARGADLLWAPGGASNTWDIGATANFSLIPGGGPAVYSNGDAVTMDDSTAIRTVAFQTQVAIQPSVLTVNTTSGYTFAYGGGSLNNGGSFTGTMKLVKEGSGTLEMQFENAFTGGAIINAGVIYQNRVGLSPPRMDPLGNGTIIFNGTSGYAFTASSPSLVQSPGAASVEINGDNFLEVTTPSAATQIMDWSLYGDGTLTLKLAHTASVSPWIPLLTWNAPMDSFTGTIKVPDTSLQGGLRFNAGAANSAAGGSSITFDLGNGSFQMFGRNDGVTYTLGALKGGVNTIIGGGGSSATFIVGTKGLDTTFHGSINDGGSIDLTYLIKSGPATFTLTKPQFYKGNTIVNGGTLVLPKMNTGSLTVVAGRLNMSVAATSGGASGTSIVRGLTIAAGASMDLTNNALIIDYDTLGNQMETLRSELADGRLIGSLSAQGMGLGYRHNEAVDISEGIALQTLETFQGEAVDASSLLIKQTYFGDSNLDGLVDVRDLYNLAMSWLCTNRFWQNGDFNYDGVVNATDLGLLAQSWQAGVGGNLGEAAGSLGLPLTGIPEPVSLAWGAISTLVLLPRRRR